MTSIRNILGFHNGGVLPKSDPVLFKDSPKPPISRTTIGSTIVNMTRVHGRLTENARKLAADIERMTEELRQNTEAVSALTVAILRIKDDPAITDSERQAAEAAIENEVERNAAAVTIDFSDIDAMGIEHVVVGDEAAFTDNVQALRGVEGVMRKGEV